MFWLTDIGRSCKNRSTAELVNVCPSDKPQDAYAVVAEEAKPHVLSIQPHLDKVWLKG